MHQVYAHIAEYGAEKWQRRAGIGSAVSTPTMLDRLYGDLQEIANAIAHRHGHLDSDNRPLSIHVRDDRNRPVFSVYVTGITDEAYFGDVAYSQGWLRVFSVNWASHRLAERVQRGEVAVGAG